MSPTPDLSRAEWIKSTYSGNGGADCVEWAPAHATTDAIPVRDSKTPDRPPLLIKPTAWSTFVSSAKTGTFNG